VTYRIKEPKSIWRLSRVPQFHGIPDHTLIRLARRRTKYVVPDRWSAIDLILKYPVPIPVPYTITERKQRGED
jgi:hypothetical protein